MKPSLEPTRRARKYGKALRWSSAFLVGGLAICACLMQWGGRLLESSDPLPPHVDAAIVLEGSLAGERARLEGAMQLLRQSVPGRVLLTLPQVVVVVPETLVTASEKVNTMACRKVPPFPTRHSTPGVPVSGKSISNVPALPCFLREAALTSVSSPPRFLAETNSPTRMPIPPLSM